MVRAGLVNVEVVEYMLPYGTWMAGEKGKYCNFYVTVGRK